MSWRIASFCGVSGDRACGARAGTFRPYGPNEYAAGGRASGASARAPRHAPVRRAAPAATARATPAVPAIGPAPSTASETLPPVAETPAPHDMGDMVMDHSATEAMGASAHNRMSESALGSYPMTRDASGTSWQPDVSTHGGLHTMRGEWMVMSHLMLNGVYDWQDGPRGDERAFVAGMAMVSARRDFDRFTVIIPRAMLSPDAWMGSEGYPLLFAAGETADGVTNLVDRQHPHDLFMELSASYARRLSDGRSMFVYAGLPGEPAFGPPAFMHRLSGMDSPEAPISHHYLDSTHITFGVLTFGYVQNDWRVEVSRFRGARAR